jgi:hypothetical protein
MMGHHCDNRRAAKPQSSVRQRRGAGMRRTMMLVAVIIGLAALLLHPDDATQSAAP